MKRSHQQTIVTAFDIFRDAAEEVEVPCKRKRFEVDCREEKNEPAPMDIDASESFVDEEELLMEVDETENGVAPMMIEGDDFYVVPMDVYESLFKSKFALTMGGSSAHPLDDGETPTAASPSTTSFLSVASVCSEGVFDSDRRRPRRSERT